MNLILDCLDSQFVRYEWADRNTAALRQALDAFKLFMQDRADTDCLSYMRQWETANRRPPTAFSGDFYSPIFFACR